MNLKVGYIVSLVVGLLLLSILLPVGLNDLIAFTSDNANVQTIVSTVIPIVAVIGILMLLIPKKSE